MRMMDNITFILARRPEEIAHQAIEASRIETENNLLREQLSEATSAISEQASINAKLVARTAEQDALIKSHIVQEVLLLARLERAESALKGKK